MVVLRALLIALYLVNLANAQPERIISLAPNVTETIYYLGAHDRLIAVSDYCNWPEDIKNESKVGGMLNPYLEKILSLKPDLVIISKDGTPKEVYHRLLNLGLKVYVFSPRYLRDIPKEIIKLGTVIGKEKEAKKLAQKFQREINKFKRVFNGEKALFIIWNEPLVVAGKSSHIHEVMKLLGLKNIAEISLINVETIIQSNPDIIFFGTGHETLSVTLISQLKDTKAMKNGHIYYITDKIYHLSPRIIEGIKEMANIRYNLINGQRGLAPGSKR